MGAIRVADAFPARAQSTQTLSTPMRVIVSHPEHDSIYVNDLACRSFGRETLRSLCNLMLENLPAGAPRPTPPYNLHHRPQHVCLLTQHVVSAMPAVCKPPAGCWNDVEGTPAAPLLRTRAGRRRAAVHVLRPAGRNGRVVCLLLSWTLNQPCITCRAVFRVVEFGSGTGGLTKDALPLLDAGLNAELLQYTATDITNAFSSGLLEAVKSPKLQFKVRARQAAWMMCITARLPADT